MDWGWHDILVTDLISFKDFPYLDRTLGSGPGLGAWNWWILERRNLYCNLLDISNLESETLIQIKIEFLMHSNWPSSSQNKCCWKNSFPVLSLCMKWIEGKMVHIRFNKRWCHQVNGVEFLCLHIKVADKVSCNVQIKQLLYQQLSRQSIERYWIRFSCCCMYKCT